MQDRYRVLEQAFGPSVTTRKVAQGLLADVSAPAPTPSAVKRGCSVRVKSGSLERPRCSRCCYLMMESCVGKPGHRLPDASFE